MARHANGLSRRAIAASTRFAKRDIDARAEKVVEPDRGAESRHSSTTTGAARISFSCVYLNESCNWARRWTHKRYTYRHRCITFDVPRKLIYFRAKFCAANSERSAPLYRRLEIHHDPRHLSHHTANIGRSSTAIAIINAIFMFKLEIRMFDVKFNFFLNFIK